MSREILEVIARNVVDGRAEEVRKSVRAAIDAGIPAKDILERGLTVAMDEVGALFEKGEIFVPEMLIAARAMQAGMDILKPLLVAGSVKEAGKVLTATVQGDLHDIGIKLVGMMLEGAGFEVTYLGIDVPATTIIEKVKELKPNILGLSALLTTTMVEMKNVVDLLRKEGLYDSVKVMVGGAPVSEEFAREIGANYGANASEAVTVARRLVAGS